MKDILELARECRAATVFGDGILFTPTQLEAFAQRIREDEREKAAKVCDDKADEHEAYAQSEDDSMPTLSRVYAKHIRRCAAAIRRGGDHG